MEEQPTCPQCGQTLDEPIPLALVGPFQVKCPFCGMLYLYQRQEDVDSIEEEVETYLSAGPFRRKMIFSDRGEPSEGDPLTKKFSCLVLCLFGPMIILGIYWLIMNLI